MKLCFSKKLTTLGMMSVLAGVALTAPTTASADLTGNIGVFSKYVLRGITNTTENNGTTVQGGFDYSHASGFYAGYWGSNLGYGNGTTATGFENDLYAGYAGQAGDASYSLGLIQYYYMEVEDSDGLEFVGSVGYGPVKAGFKYLTNDVAWGNTGDIYWTVDYSASLPMDFGFGASLGYYTYEESGDFIATTANDSAFRHLNLSLTHPIGDTGANMNVTYVIGGEDRQGNEQEDALVLGVTYGFEVK